MFQRSVAPLKQLVSPQGFEGLVEQAVRVLRWGLWMAPVINSFLRQSPTPSWYNQDGAVRTGAATIANMFLPVGSFRDWSLSVFTGLLAYDWLRVLIWFDHMGLRVATLVNLTFIGGDRLDEAAARYVGYAGRTRVIPEGIRRFATWAPLLIPFYIPRGPAWDQAWTGAETIAQVAAADRHAVLSLVFAYALACALHGGSSSWVIARHWNGRKRFRRHPLRPARPRALLHGPNSFRPVERLHDGRSDGRRARLSRRGRRRAGQLPDRHHAPARRSVAAARALRVPARHGRRRGLEPRLRAHQGGRGRLFGQAIRP